ncbi:MAG: DUF3883 domain-containing protein [Pseudonocardia sp.]
MASSSRPITDQNLGAWVVKCNPDKWDLPGFITAGGAVIEDWSVRENYRSTMMCHGQRVLLWVMGPSTGAAMARGFWGSGWITGSVEAAYQTAECDDLSAEDEELASDFWIDEETASRVEFIVPMTLPLWEKPVSEAEMVGVPGLDQIEAIRSRQGSNPSWLSADELALLDPLLPPWPAITSERGRVVTVSPIDAGFGDPVTREVVEHAAIRAVTARYESDGCTVMSVEREKCGWDLTCTAPDGREEHVEVKGVAGSDPVVLLTRNEHRSALHDDGWTLAVVTRAVSAPKVTLYPASTVARAAEPYVYRVDLR